MSATPRPTPRGVGALGAFVLVVVAAAASGTPELVPLAIVLGLPLAASPWLAHRRARRAAACGELHGHAEPSAVEVGQVMQFKLSVTNRSTRGQAFPPLGLPSIDGQWRSRPADLRPGRWDRWLAPASTLTQLPGPSPGRTESLSLPVPTTRRGVFELSPQRCWAHDPFGLCAAPGPLTPTVHTVVYPRPMALDRAIVEPRSAVAAMGAVAGSRAGSGLGDLEGIRPYVPGDRLSLLHWPAKARDGTWFVKHFTVEGSAAVPVIVDDRVGVHRRSDFERLVSAARWAIEDAMAGHHDVLFMTLSGRRYLLDPSEQGRAEARLLLAETRPVRLSPASRFSPIPSDAVVLTTETGAERLTRQPSGGPSGTDRDTGVAIGTSRVIVV
jgi:uncharacterized protein (DUF58 family)